MIANTVTFGMIPGINERAAELVRTNGFYQFVNIASVIGREFLIGAATGGIANLATRGLSAAGSMGLRFVASQLPGAVVQGAGRAAGALTCRLTMLNRLVQPIQAVSNVSTMANNLAEARAAIARGDFETAGRLLANTGGMISGTVSALRESSRFARAVATLDPQQIRGYLAACFAGGTPIWGEFGPRPIETFREGDKVWARDENDPNGPLELKVIEETFVTIGQIWHLHIGGEVVRTTDEHPWWVEGKGWTATMLLQPGDRIIGRDGTSVAVEEAYDTGEVETVYNFRVAEHHTYFVGDATWGFDLWSHNTCTGKYSAMHHDPSKPAGARVHHLNQHAAFGKTKHVPGGMPYRQAISLYLSKVQHDDFHREMNKFWAPYRKAGTLTPTVREFAAAQRAALLKVGVSPADVIRSSRDAHAQRMAFGFLPSMDVPYVPKA